MVFLLVTLISLWSMFEILGRKEKWLEVTTLKRVHKLAGIAFAILFIGLSLACLCFIIPNSGELGFRGLLHFLLAVAVFSVFSVKFAIVRRYRQLLKYVQGMGLSLFFLSVLLFATSGGYYLMMYKLSSASSSPLEVNAPARETDINLVQKGAQIFSDNCIYCHEVESTEIKMGPGLKGILRNPTLPSSKKPATPENIIGQLTNPYKMMPSFKEKLSQDQLKALIEYLKTL